MTTLTVLGSGSSGNCYFLEANDTAILIDLGIGIRLFKRHTNTYGLNQEHIKAIVVTHDHADHVKAVGYLSQQRHIPVYATRNVHEGMLRNRFLTKKVPQEMRHDIAQDETFSIGPFRLTPFHIKHDASDNSGYFIAWDIAADLLHPASKGTLLLMTDIGTIPDKAKEYVPQADYIVFESNYDEQMLRVGPYPARLKGRILGAYGHTSNAETAAFLKAHLTPRTRHIWLCHLSQENNTPDIAQRTTEQALQGLTFAPPPVTPLKRREPSGRIVLDELR